MHCSTNISRLCTFIYPIPLSSLLRCYSIFVLLSSQGCVSMHLFLLSFSPRDIFIWRNSLSGEFFSRTRSGATKNDHPTLHAHVGKRETEIEGNASLWVCVRERERVGKSVTYCVDVCLLFVCVRERELGWCMLDCYASFWLHVLRFIATKCVCEM